MTLSDLHGELLKARASTCDFDALFALAERLAAAGMPKAGECVDAAASCRAESDQFLRYALTHVAAALGVEEAR